MHGICGIWGVLFAGLFATPEYVGQAYLNGKYGGFYGGGGNLFACQIIGVLVIGAWVMTLTGALFMALKFFKILRISPEEEQAGLDVSKHGGSAYNCKCCGHSDSVCSCCLHMTCSCAEDAVGVVPECGDAGSCMQLSCGQIHWNTCIVYDAASSSHLFRA
eukprot:GHUV01045131.1.p1 GENE.GHUV01045131.1~~GHUV01045131.1.p1  ORF type:complete len:161 (-),score=33.26 GHUV01045131.1:200-682(-)